VAVSTASTQEDPGDHGNVVAFSDGVVTIRARRARSDNREVTWDAIYHDVEEGSDDEAHERAVDEEQGHEGVVAGWGLGTTQPY
jgi:hypothetical protein